MKLRDFFQKYNYVILLLLISIAAYWRWFKPGMFTHSDLWFEFNSSLKDFLHFPIWISNMDFGSTDVTFWRSATYNLILGLSSNFSNGFGVAERVAVMLPIALLGASSGYFLCRQIVINKKASFIGGLVFGFNTYFLAINTQGHLLLTLAAILSTYSLAYFIKAIKTKKQKFAIAASLLLLLATGYDLRFAYILIGIVIGYMIFCVYLSNKRKEITSTTSFIIFGLSFFLLSVYWLLPTFFSGTGLSNSQLNRDLFGSEFWKLTDSLTLHHPFWSGSSISWFVMHDPQIYLWLLPILAFVGFYVNKKNKEIMYFGIVGIVGILLSKQTDQPVSSLYPYLYQHLPGFNAFREASKFYYPIALAYSILIASLVSELDQGKIYKSKTYSKIIVIVIIAITTINLYPQISGKLASIYVPRTIPSDYQKLHDFIEPQGEYFRTLWIPGASRWATYSNRHPMVDMGHVENQDWSNLINGDNPPALSRTETKDSQLNFLSSEYAQQIMDSASIKYVIVPIQDNVSDDNFYKYYGYYRQDYLAALNNISWLKKVSIGTENLQVYQSTGYKPYISTFKNLVNYSSYNSLNEQIKNMSQNNILGVGFSVAINNKLATTNVKDLFASPNSYKLAGNSINTAVKKSLTTQIIVKSDSDYDYTISKNGNNINFDKKLVRKTNPALTDSNPYVNKKQYNVDTEKSYFYSTDNITLNKIDSRDHIISNQASSLKIYTKIKENLISDSKLYKNTTGFKLVDCNKSEGSPLISMSFQSNYTNSSRSLRLVTGNDVACATSQQLLEEASGTYILSFDYQAKGTQQIAYGISYKIGQNIFYKQTSVEVHDQNKHQLLKLLHLPAGSHDAKLSVLGYPDDQQKQTAFTTYENLSFTPATQVFDLTNEMKSSYEHLSISPKKDNRLTIYQQSLVTKNAIPNNSFESGLWQKKVGDCNNYDNKGKVGMALDDKIKIDGKHSIKLFAQNHIACTSSKSFPIKPSASYIFSLRYKSLNTKQVGYSISYDNADKNQVNKTKVVNGSNWQELQDIINVPSDATHASVTLYAYSDQASDLIATNWYDKLSLTEVPSVSDRYYEVQNNIMNLSNPKVTKIDQISSTKKIISINGASGSFYLGMGESFNKQWKLDYDHGRSVDENKHFKLNGYSNGWLIDTAKICHINISCKINSNGTYNITFIAVYEPQHYFYIGLIISGATFVLSILYLIYKLIDDKK